MEDFLLSMVPVLLIASLVSTAVYRIINSLLEDLWIDWLGHKGRAAFDDTIIALCTGVSGGLAGYFWEKAIEGVALHGMLIGFGATSIGTLIVRFIKRRFE